MPCELKEKERMGVINPIFTCQPAGAQYVSIGIKDCIAIVHGGQGCVMFVRLWFSQHFKESFEIASSSLHEDSAVFGGTHRVEQAVDVLLMRYPDVKVVPIITTCSTEIIGDDIDGAVAKLNNGLLKEKYAGREVHLIPIHTPSFQGSHVTGYDVAAEAIIKHFAKSGMIPKLNVFTGWQNPGDTHVLKHLLAAMEVPANLIFDNEEFDAPLMPEGNYVAHGSTTIEDLANTGSATATIVLNRYEGGKAAAYLQSKFHIPAVIGPSPIGIRNTDVFLQNVKKITGKAIPKSLVKERGIAIDAITDVAHMFLADKRVAIYGNPDLVIGLAEFCLDLGMKPVLLLLGDENSNYPKDPRIQELQNNVDYDMEIIMNADLWELGDRLQNQGLKLDLILGHSKGRFIAMDYHIPLVRVGFPIYDRAGYYHYATVGYEGARVLAERMANVWFNDMEYTKNKEWLLGMW